MILDEAVVQTKRKGITHLHKMTPSNFIAFARALLKSRKVNIKFKVDGASIRFGKDEDGKFFLESSYSGPIQNYGDFTKRNIEKGYSTTFSVHFDEMFKTIKDSGIWKHLDNDVKINGEMLWNPMATDDGESFKFVSVSYPKAKLGKTCSLVLFNALKASTGEGLPYDHCERLLKYSTDDVKIIKGDTGYHDVSVDAVFDPLTKLDPKDLDDTLKSRKKIDAERKAFYIKIIDEMKAALQKELSSNKAVQKAAEERLGPNSEGIVIYVDDFIVKITTDYYKQTSGHTG